MLGTSDIVERFKSPESQLEKALVVLITKHRCSRRGARLHTANIKHSHFILKLQAAPLSIVVIPFISIFELYFYALVLYMSGWWI